MLDRMISGAGAVADGADRSVRLLTSGSSGSRLASRPASVVVAILLFAIAALLLLAGLDATDPATPATLAPAALARASAGDLRERTYAAVDGSLLTTWVETYDDVNANGIEDPDEHGIAWFYWLVDQGSRRGVTVRSERSPGSIFRFQGAGVIDRDPGYARMDDPWSTSELAAAGLSIAPDVIVDTTGAVGATVPLDLADAPSGVGTAVAIDAPRLGGYVAVCSADDDADGVCDEDEVDGIEIVAFDPASKRGIRVLLDEPPEFSQASLTGMLRHEERSVDDARTTDGLHFSDFDIDVSDGYILDEGVSPRTAPLAFVLAFGLALLAGIILVGVAGGYLIYRRSAGPLPDPATTLGPSERLPLRITGLVRTPTGTAHLREVPGDLVRFVLGRRLVASEEGTGSADETTDDDATSETTLIIERSDVAQGVAVGLGELRRVSSGQVMAFRAPRPALRVVAGTGPLVLSFETAAERDRAAAELLDESGFGPDGAGMQPG